MLMMLDGSQSNASNCQFYTTSCYALSYLKFNVISAVLLSLHKVTNSVTLMID